MLGPADPLPATSRRFLVTGTSGAGKTTLARLIGAAVGVPTVEIDSLHHGPGWTVLPTFVAEVTRFADGPAWTIEWQYHAVKPLLLRRADVLVWLDHGRWTVMSRVVRRTVIRRLRRQELWNGNVEPPLWTFWTDRDHIVRWAWRTYAKRSAESRAVADAPDGAGPVVVRLAGQRQVDAWLSGPLAALGGAVSPGGPIQS
jgi:adenylate kinase family enzyme